MSVRSDIVDNNRKMRFFFIIGIATLLMSIIGATFAFFSASANVTGGNNVIAGSTNDALANALSAKVERINFTFSGTGNDVAPSTDNLVPTNLASNSNLNLVKGAINSKCVSNGYTGCHLYRITASSTQTIAGASLNLTTLYATATVKSDWQYIIMSGSGSDTQNTVTVNSLALVNGGSGSMDLASPFDMHQGAGMTANQNYVYYLLVFLNDDGNSQNKGDANDATGVYNGSVTFTTVGGGQVTVNFSDVDA